MRACFLPWPEFHHETLITYITSGLGAPAEQSSLTPIQTLMKRHRVISLVSLVALAVATGFGTPARAQSAASDQAGIQRTNLISSNPIGIIFEWFNGEFEHAIKPTVSLAVAGSHFGFDDANYTSIDGIARYYPSARAIRGFSIGGSVGGVRVSEDNCDGCTPFDESAFTLGIRGDYVWILGRDQRFAVAAGIGAKRLFYSENDNVGTEGLPIGRLSVGYAW